MRIQQSEKLFPPHPQDLAHSIMKKRTKSRQKRSRISTRSAPEAMQYQDLASSRGNLNLQLAWSSCGMGSSEIP